MKENKTFSQSTAEFIKKHTKTAVNTIIVASIATASFKLGSTYQSLKKETPKVENPYSHAFSPEEISIAVNEANELIMIERKTGDYIVYSDEIGMTIFKMYTNRIYQNAVAND